MQLLSVKNYSLYSSLSSGQLFRWQPIRGGYEILTSSDVIRVREEPQGLAVNTLADTDMREFFRITDDYTRIYSDLSADEHIGEAVAGLNGLRLFKQDPWDALLAFVLSSCSNIPRIALNLNLLSENFGAKLHADGRKVSLLPKPEQIKSGRRLASCRLGYREKYVAVLPGIIDNKFFGTVSRLSYLDARDRLCELPGVAEKVADCVLLFGLGFNEAFPIDVWVRRALQQYFFNSKKVPYWKLSEAARARYGKNAGYAQQFLYHSLRTRKIRSFVSNER